MRAEVGRVRNRTISRRIDRMYGQKVRRRWWSLLNWLQGYKFCPVQRCRRCSHTSPFHTNVCPNYAPSQCVHGTTAGAWYCDCEGMEPF